MLCHALVIGFSIETGMQAGASTEQSRIIGIQFSIVGGHSRVARWEEREAQKMKKLAMKPNP